MLPEINKNTILKVSDLFKAVLNYDEIDFQTLNINPDVFYKYMFNRLTINFNPLNEELEKKINSVDNIISTNFNYKQYREHTFSKVRIVNLIFTNSYYNIFEANYENFIEKKNQNPKHDYFVSYISRIEFFIEDKGFILERYPRLRKNDNSIEFIDFQVLIYSRKDSHHYKTFSQEDVFIFKSAKLPILRNNEKIIDRNILRTFRNIYDFHENITDENNREFTFYLYDTVNKLNWEQIYYEPILEIIKKGPFGDNPRYEVEENEGTTFNNFVKVNTYNKINAHMYFQTMIYNSQSSKDNYEFKFQTISGFSEERAQIMFLLPYYIRKDNLEIYYCFKDSDETTASYQSKNFQIIMYIKENRNFYKKVLLNANVNNGRVYIHSFSGYVSKGVKMFLTEISRFTQLYGLFWGFSDSDLQTLKTSGREIFGTYNNDYNAKVINNKRIEYATTKNLIIPEINLFLNRNEILLGVTNIYESEFEKNKDFTDWYV